MAISLKDRLAAKIQEDMQQRSDFIGGQDSIVGDLGSEQDNIDVNLIDTSPYQPRLKICETDIDDRARDIEARGQISAIVVRRKHNGRYELIDGEHRWRAMIKLGRTYILADIKRITDRQAALMAVAANTQRKGYTDYENALSMQRIDSDGLLGTSAEMASVLGIQVSDLYRLKAFFALPEAAQKLLKEQPDLISRRSADALKSAYLNYGESSVPAILEAMPLIGKKELRVEGITKWLAEKLGPKPTKTKNTRKVAPPTVFNSGAGAKLAELNFDQKKNVFKISLVNKELANEFQEYVNQFFDLARQKTTS